MLSQAPFTAQGAFQNAKVKYLKALDLHFFKNHFKAYSPVTMDTRKGVTIGVFSDLPLDQSEFIVVWEVSYIKNGSNITSRNSKFISLKDDYYKDNEIDSIDFLHPIWDNPEYRVSDTGNQEMAEYMIRELDREIARIRDSQINWDDLMLVPQQPTESVVP
jgi:hypothetical protein